MIEMGLFLGEDVPLGTSIKRVHALLLTKDGRVLLRFKNGEARLTGGRIDNGDANIVEALRREILEEINCQFDKCDYLGYVECDNGMGSEIWARFVVRVAEIGTQVPDPDREGNWVYGRVLAPYDYARKEMMEASAFAESNALLLERAYAIARQQGYFTDVQNSDVYIINAESRDS